MKNNKESKSENKNQSNSISDKNNTPVKKENNAPDKGKKKDSTAIEAEETKAMNPDSNNRKPLFRK